MTELHGRFLVLIGTVVVVGTVSSLIIVSKPAPTSFNLLVVVVGAVLAATLQVALAFYAHRLRQDARRKGRE